MRNLDVSIARAQMVRGIREFFFARNVLEVETPLFSPFSCIDSHVDVFTTQFVPEGGSPQQGYLQTSPEMFMKRLLCAGYPSMFQICKSFRNGEAGRRHNPEFTLLEWYRLNFSEADLRAEVLELCVQILGEKPALTKTYQDWFLETLGWDPFNTGVPEILDFIGNREPAPAFNSKDDLLHFCMANYVEPAMPKDHYCFVTEFPASQAALARLHPEKPEAALRFELYFNGNELCNGYEELSDPEEYRRRFANINDERKAEGKEPLKMDEKLLEDLKKGLPKCSGVAMGLDRLLMLVTKITDIRQVLNFPVGLN